MISAVVAPVGRAVGFACESCHRVTRDLVYVDFEEVEGVVDEFIVCERCAPSHEHQLVLV